MKYIIAVLAFIGVMHLGSVTQEHRQLLLTEQPPGYEETWKVVVNHEENTCSDDSQFFNIVLTVAYVTGADFAGQYDHPNRIISLNDEEGMDIDTVAHEVSHAVDDIMKSHRLIDNHYEAYLQGVYTACVWSIVENDMYSTTIRFLK